MNKKNRIRSLSLLLVFAMLLSCFAIKLNANTAQAAAKLKVSSPKVVAVNCKIAITTNVKATFKSSNKKIATVNKKGVVTGKKKGKVKITVTSKKNKKQKKTVKITVKNKLVILQPSSSSATLMQGESLKIKANKASKFKSSNPQVAAVNNNGKVTANKAGTAIITVTAKKKKNQKKTVTIVVKAKEVTKEIPAETPKPISKATPTPIIDETPMPTPEETKTPQPTQEATPTPTSSVTPTPQPTETTTPTPTSDVTPTPTSNATPFPTDTPMTTPTPIPAPTPTPTPEPEIEKIEANYKGRTLDETIGSCGFIVEVFYKNNTSRMLSRNEYSEEYQKVIVQDGKIYYIFLVEYKGFTKEVYIEVEYFDEGTIQIPAYLILDYADEYVPRNTPPDLSKMSVQLHYKGGPDVELDSSEVYVGKIEDENTYVAWEIAYDYYTEIDGKEFYMLATGYVTVFYE